MLVATDTRSASERLLRCAARLAELLDLSLTVLFVETPGPQAPEPAGALAIVADQDATIAKVPAGSVLAGAVAYAAMSPVRHIVLSQKVMSRPSRPWSIRTAHAMPAGVDVTWIAADDDGSARAKEQGTSSPIRPGAYAIAGAAVLATAPVLLLLRHVLGEQGLGLLFVFPVLGIAARLGFRPALVAVVVSTLLYDLLVLRPGASPGVIAAQDLVVTGVLLIVAGYASVLTGRLRERVALSDRSAQENAAIATFGTGLARAGDWESTGALVCAEVASMFGVAAAVFRERDGELEMVAAEPAGATFGPLDRTALDWAWQQGEEAGSGAASASAADWRFHPLRTSLGTLAVLAVASEDGRSPIAPSRRLLFDTLLAQAALAHERLKLEDALREDRV